MLAVKSLVSSPFHFRAAVCSLGFRAISAERKGGAVGVIRTGVVDDSRSQSRSETEWTRLAGDSRFVSAAGSAREIRRGSSRHSSRDDWQTRTFTLFDY